MNFRECLFRIWEPNATQEHWFLMGTLRTPQKCMGKHILLQTYPKSNLSNSSHVKASGGFKNTQITKDRTHLSHHLNTRCPVQPARQKPKLVASLEGKIPSVSRQPGTTNGWTAIGMHCVFPSMVPGARFIAWDRQQLQTACKFYLLFPFLTWDWWQSTCVSASELRSSQKWIFSIGSSVLTVLPWHLQEHKSPHQKPVRCPSPTDFWWNTV